MKISKKYTLYGIMLVVLSGIFWVLDTVEAYQPGKKSWVGWTHHVKTGEYIDIPCVRDGKQIAKCAKDYSNRHEKWADEPAYTSTYSKEDKVWWGPNMPPPSDVKDINGTYGGGVGKYTSEGDPSYGPLKILCINSWDLLSNPEEITRTDKKIDVILRKK